MKGLFARLLKWGPRVPFLKRSAKKSYLIILSWCSFLSLTNFFSLQKSNIFCQNIKRAMFYELIFFCKTLSCHFFSLYGLFFHAKKVFFNAIYNGERLVKLRNCVLPKFMTNSTYICFLGKYSSGKLYEIRQSPVCTDLKLWNDRSGSSWICGFLGLRLSVGPYCLWHNGS